MGAIFVGLSDSTNQIMLDSILSLSTTALLGCVLALSIELLFAAIGIEPYYETGGEEQWTSKPSQS